MGRVKVFAPKVIVDNSKRETAPFVDATGLHEGALLGDIKHDPFKQEDSELLRMRELLLEQSTKRTKEFCL